MVDLNKLKNHPKNPNKHGQDQIERLVQLFNYHGIRHPIIVSNQSGCITAGHGRKLAALRAGMKDYPIVYQDYASPEAEYAFLTSDNAIADWAELDLAQINVDMLDLGPDFDIDMLGVKNLTLDFDKEFDPNDEDDDDDEKEKSTKTCPHCGESL